MGGPATGRNPWNTQNVTKAHRFGVPADSPGRQAPLAAVQELKRSFGIDARRIDAVGCLLAGGEFRSVAELVCMTGAPRRTVEAVLRAAGPHLESSGERVRISPARARTYAAEFGCGEGEPARDPWEELARRDSAALAEAARLTERAPPAQRELDQVPATPETVLKRGHYLLRSFDLRGAHVLCVGDHDLTSLGLFLAGGAAGLRVSVVDADERLLAYIDTEAAWRGFDVRCYAADLRLGLPAALHGSAQLAFTDPPYTPEGVHLFVTRGLQGIGDQRNGRVLVAYGHGEQPALGLAVQEALEPLHLVYEAVLPGFNHYAGAQAIGSTAALYQLRPTRRSSSAVRAVADTIRPELYTHGAQSVESAATRLGGATAARILDLAAVPAPGALLVGEGWPAEAGGQRLPLSRLLAEPLPRALQDRGAVVVNLYPGFGSLLLRAMLAANAPRVAIVCRNDAAELREAVGQRDLAELIVPKYRMTRLLRSTPEPDMAVIVADQAPAAGLSAAEQVTAFVWGRPHGKLGNVWREGLIAAAKSRIEVLTKNDARRIIASVWPSPDVLEHSLLDLPRHLYPALAEAIRRSATAAVPA
jgi:N4-bis(aminopropyl)spermidine synthase